MKRLLWLLLCSMAFGQGITVGPHTTIGPHTTVAPGTSGGGGGTTTFLNTNTAFQVSSTSYSGSATVNTGGTNVVAFFPVCYDDNGGSGAESITAISFNSVSILSNTTGAAIEDTLRFVNCIAFYYINPPTGSKTLAITCSGCSEIYGNVVVFQGANQSTPVRSGTYQTCSGTGTSGCGGTTTTPTMTITSNANDLTFSCIEVGDGSTVTSTNQTSDGINNSGNNGFGSDHATTAASSITDTWTLQDSSYAMLGFSIQHN